jgi:hypothetical protein
LELLPAELRSAIASRFPIGSQEGRGEDAVVLVKFFFPAGRYTFFVTEGEPVDDDFHVFGYCISPFGPDCDEWGYAALSELSGVVVRGLSMERDLHLPFATRTVGELLHAAA